MPSEPLQVTTTRLDDCHLHLRDGTAVVATHRDRIVAALPT